MHTDASREDESFLFGCEQFININGQILVNTYGNRVAKGV